MLDIRNMYCKLKTVGFYLKFNQYLQGANQKFPFHRGSVRYILTLDCKWLP